MESFTYWGVSLTGWMRNVYIPTRIILTEIRGPQHRRHLHLLSSKHFSKMDLVVNLQFFGHKMSTVAEKSLALELPITALEMPTLTWLVPAVATRRWCSARQVHRCRRKVSLTTPWGIIKWTLITHTRHGRLERPCHVGTIWCRICLNDEWNAGK